jgi:hypothetical protein
MNTTAPFLKRAFFMEKKIPKLTVQLLTAIAVTLAQS